MWRKQCSHHSLHSHRGAPQMENTEHGTVNFLHEIRVRVLIENSDRNFRSENALEFHEENSYILQIHQCHC